MYCAFGTRAVAKSDTSCWTVVWRYRKPACCHLAGKLRPHHVDWLGLRRPVPGMVGDYRPGWKRSHLEWPYTGCRDMEMQLNEREASLLGAFRRLPPDTAMELSALAERLAELAPNRRIDWSDSWSDQDLNEFRAASLRRLDAEESEDQG